MRTLDEMLSEQMKDEEFRKEYEEIQSKTDEIRAATNANTQNVKNNSVQKHTFMN